MGGGEGGKATEGVKNDSGETGVPKRGWVWGVTQKWG